MAIKKCPDCGSNKIQRARIRTLSKMMTFLLPLQAGECVECRRPRLLVMWRQIPVRFFVWLLILGSLFVFYEWVGVSRPIAAKTYKKQLRRYQRQKLIKPDMIKSAVKKEEMAESLRVRELKQQIKSLENQIIHHRDQPPSSKDPLAESNLEGENQESASNSHRTQTNTVIEDEIQIVLKSLETWRIAWQSQNVEAYISQYTDAFGDSNGSSRKAWLKERQVKLTKPKKISVMIDDVQLTKLDSKTWEATFRQRYQSDLYKDVVRKTLTFKKVGDQYLIDDERS